MLFLVLVADFFVLVFVNGIVIFSFLVIFVFVNENHTAHYLCWPVLTAVVGLLTLPRRSTRRWSKVVSTKM